VRHKLQQVLQHQRKHTVQSPYCGLRGADLQRNCAVQLGPLQHRPAKIKTASALVPSSLPVSKLPYWLILLNLS
jgi:hypothetical protein